MPPAQQEAPLKRSKADASSGVRAGPSLPGDPGLPLTRQQNALPDSPEPVPGVLNGKIESTMLSSSSETSKCQPPPSLFLSSTGSSAGHTSMDHVTQPSFGQDFTLTPQRSAASVQSSRTSLDGARSEAVSDRSSSMRVAKPRKVSSSVPSTKSSPMEVSEFIEQLIQRDSPEQNKSGALANMRIFIVTEEQEFTKKITTPTRKKLEFVSASSPARSFLLLTSPLIFARYSKTPSQVMKNGGTLAAEFNSTTTHIISDRSEKQTCRVLGLKDITEVPANIPIVPWKWVAACVNVKSNLDASE